MSDGHVGGAVNPLDDEQASREVAEANQVKDLVERMHTAFRDLRWLGIVPLPQDATLGLLEKAAADFEASRSDMASVSWVEVALVLGSPKRGRARSCFEFRHSDVA